MSDDLVTLGLMVTVFGSWAGLKIRTRLALLKRRSERRAERAEAERLEGCQGVVRFFANHLGFLARESVPRSRLEGMIASGISAENLAGFLWQVCEDVPGLQLGHLRLGDANYPVRLPERLRERHVYIVGRSGMGKTTLIQNLVLQDLDQGAGLAVLAPERELLTEEILPFIPEDRWSDVIYINPADTEHPVPLNPLHMTPGEDLDLKVDETLTIFRRVFGDERAGAPRMETTLRQTFYSLMQMPGATLLDVRRLLDRQDPSFRQQVVERLEDEEAKVFWTSVYPSFPRDAHLPIINRLDRLLRPQVVRSLLCTPGRCLDVREAMDLGKILLFNLSDGILGEANAQLLGQLVVARIQLAAMSRADVPKAERRPFSLYIDEFQTFCGVASGSYEKLLSRARKYRIGLVLAHQQTGQLGDTLLKEILGNVSTMISFGVGASDAARLARELVGEVDGIPQAAEPRDLLALRVGQAVTKIGQSVFLLQTEPPPTGGRVETRDAVIGRSRSQFGVAPEGPDPHLVPAREPRKPGVPLDTLDPEEIFGP